MTRLDLRYQVTPADLLPLPRNYADVERHVGFCQAELQGPYGSLARPRTTPILDGPREALIRGESPSAFAYPVSSFAKRLVQPGHEQLENRWARSGNQVFVACTTVMPGVTPQMWDWWFAWHGSESTRYKLWNPDAHVYAGWGDERSTLAGEFREQYVNNVSYVDEYIGAAMQRLAIRFVPPAQLGFSDRDVDGAQGVAICARVGFSHLPVLFGWLVHYVRPIEGGSEMRSRFLLGDVEVVPELLRSEALARAGSALRFPVASQLSRLALPRTLGRDMLYHCAAEMHHLAQLLPELYAVFGPEHTPQLTV